MTVASITVPMGPCQCPGTPHDEDTIDLRERLDFESGRTLQALPYVWNTEGLDPATITARLTVAYIQHGAVAWNLVDEAGQPVPLNKDTLYEHLLSDFERASGVSDRADELYGAVVVGPLVNAASRSSATTTTDVSTSPTPIGSAKRRKRALPSSTTTTGTGVTATTSA